MGSPPILSGDVQKGGIAGGGVAGARNGDFHIQITGVRGSVVGGMGKEVKK